MLNEHATALKRKRDRQERWLDPIGTFRSLPEPFRSMWLDDETSVAILRKMRRSELWLTGSRLCVVSSIGVFLASEALLLSIGGPLNPLSIVLRALIAGTTSVPLYTASIFMQARAKSALAKQAAELTYYQANRHARLARSARDRGIERSVTSDSQLAALDDVGNSLNRIVDAYRALSETRSAGTTAATFALLYTPFYSLVALLLFPPIALFLRHRWKSVRLLSQEAEQQTRDASAVTAIRDRSAAERTTIEGLRSSRAAGLGAAAEEIHERFVIDAIDAQQATSAARLKVESAVLRDAGRLAAVLMWCSAALSIPPAVMLNILGPIQVKASSAGPEAAFHQTLDDYSSKVRLAASTLATLAPAPSIDSGRGTAATRLDSTAARPDEFRQLYIEGLCASHGPSKHGAPVHLGARPGTLTMILGENRSGKSSLLDAIRYKAQSCGGHVGFRFREPATQAELDRNIALIRTTSKPHLQEMRQLWDVTKQQQIDAMVRFGLEPDVARDVVEEKRAYSSLTEGEKIRVVMAPHICHCPQRVLLLDEPLAKLDPPAKRFFVQTTKAVAQERKLTVVMASNEVEGVVDADTILILRRVGRPTSQERPSEMLNPIGWPRWTRPFLIPEDPTIAAIRQRLPIRELLELKEHWEPNIRAADLTIPSARDAARVMRNLIMQMPENVGVAHLADTGRRPATVWPEPPIGYRFSDELVEAFTDLAKADASSEPSRRPYQAAAMSSGSVTFY